MATDVIMPALGMAQDTGKLLRWLKAEGDQVQKGEALMEVETDKVTVEVESPAEGTLAVLGAAEGEDVPVGNRVALILAPNESVPEPAAPVEPA
jgi:pyruvate dehydrogenase E2 component (dihydrolipoamide acetyltransferase)